MVNAIVLAGKDGKMPIKQSGEILTKKEFLDLIIKISVFYETISDVEIDEYNYQVLYELYRSLGESDAEVRSRLDNE